MKRILLSEIASRFGMELRGNDCVVSGVNTLSAAGPDELSFLANPKYVDELKTTRAAAVIVHPDHADEVGTALVSRQPYQDFGYTLTLFARKQGFFSGISEQAFIHPEARVGDGVSIAPFACIGPRAVIEQGVSIFPYCYVGEDCVVGEGSVLYPGAVLMAGCVIGKACTVHPGAVLGADGFGFTRAKNTVQKIPQVGTVRIGDGVEVGANSTIDRAALDVTSIGDGTKIDNLVQIGHNVRVGKNSFLVSQVGIAGSCILGDNVTLAGQVGLAGHLRIGNNATIGPQAGVAKDVPENMTVSGSPAVDHGTYMRTAVLMPKFPELFKRIARLEKEMLTLREQIQATNKEQA